MKITNTLELYKNFKAGDVVYGTAFAYTNRKNGLATHQTPVLGMLAAGKTAADHAAYIARSQYVHIRYFVPFNQKGQPIWSRVVKATARVYATTETEAYELYNQLIQDEIDWHKSEIKSLERYKLP